MSRSRKLGGALPLLLVVFAALVLLHGWTTPPFEAPDEVWHYAYARWVAEGHGLPSMADNASGANQQVAQPPLYYGVAALLSTPFEDDDLQALFWHNPNFGYQASGTVTDNKNMLIHPTRPWTGSRAALALRVTRLASLIFGALTVVAAWGLGREAFGDERGALLTAALVAFHPQFVFISSVVSNDSAVAALGTAALWSAARVVRRGLTLRNAAVTGALVGLALIAKTSALPLLPLLGLVLAWAGRRRRETLPGALGVYVAVALLLGGWWYARNALLYGDPLGLTSHVSTLWGREEMVPLFELLPEVPLLIRSFWGAYGWGHVFWPEVVYLALSVLALPLLARGVYRLGHRIASSDLRLPRSLPPQAVILTLALVWLGTILAALLHWMRQVQAPHGRLLFPAIGAWALLLAAGARRTRPAPTLSPTGRAVLILLFVVTALAPGARILATFAPPRTYPGEHLPPVGEFIGLTYGGRARLLRAGVEPRRAHPGDEVGVRACWEALKPMSEDYTVFVQLLGPKDLIVGARRTYPGLGRFPTSLWEVGRAFCETYAVTVHDGAGAPVRYRVEVGLFNSETGERLDARDAAGDSISPPVVGSVAVVPEGDGGSPPPPDGIAHLSERILLEGYQAPEQVEAGEPLTVTLRWRALEDVDEDLVAFVHLWRPGDAQPLAQDDAPPRGGWFPTSAWRAGDRVPDVHVLRPPADLPAGSYPLWAGLYRPEDGSRLRATGREARLPHDLVPLGTVEVMDPD
jgi:hypothetical protein